MYTIQGLHEPGQAEGAQAFARAHAQGQGQGQAQAQGQEVRRPCLVKGKSHVLLCTCILHMYV
jgi:hypothetical protein